MPWPTCCFPHLPRPRPAVVRETHANNTSLRAGAGAARSATSATPCASATLGLPELSGCHRGLETYRPPGLCVVGGTTQDCTGQVSAGQIGTIQAGKVQPDTA